MIPPSQYTPAGPPGMFTTPSRMRGIDAEASSASPRLARSRVTAWVWKASKRFSLLKNAGGSRASWNTVRSMKRARWRRPIALAIAAMPNPNEVEKLESRVSGQRPRTVRMCRR